MLCSSELQKNRKSGTIIFYPWNLSSKYNKNMNWKCVYNFKVKFSVYSGFWMDMLLRKIEKERETKYKSIKWNIILKVNVVLFFKSNVNGKKNQIFHTLSHSLTLTLIHTHISNTYGLSECLFEFEKYHSQPFEIVFEWRIK